MMLDTQRELKALALRFESPVNSVTYNAHGSAAAFGLGDGSVHIAGSQRITVKPHAGAVPSIVPYGEDGFLSLSDDGTLKFLSSDGTVSDIADFKGAWTERLAAHPKGAFAVAVGRHVHLWTKLGAEAKILGPHDGSVTDICFAADGMGLAAAHRDGVTLWAWPHYEPQPMRLAWKGAHLAVTVSADKRWVVTAMQEGALHMWNVPLKRDYQMRGYWTKPTSMAWSADKRWLATSGSETAIIWPFDKQGPEGREPQQLGWSNAALVTRVAGHGQENIFAAGFEDGAVTMIDLRQKKAFIASAPSGHAVTALAFSPEGMTLAVGLANGAAALLDFS